eukprot:jgi/Psemu1/36897/gm1.36897_g
MVMKLRFKVGNPCWSPASSLDPRQSPTIEVRAISIIDPTSCQVKWVEPSLETNIDPNAPTPVAIKEEPMP